MFDEGAYDYCKWWYLIFDMYYFIHEIIIKNGEIFLYAKKLDMNKHFNMGQIWASH
jgi:hypothetical protein